MDHEIRSLLRELERFAAQNDAQATDRRQMMLNITPETGELLAILVQATKARRVLEIGTSNGYSTLWLADAVRPIGGSVVTVEVSEAKAEMAKQNLKRAGLSRWVHQEVMDAGQFLTRQDASRYELIFLDAERKEYSAWWLRLQSALVAGGLLIVDNAVSHAGEMEEFIAQVGATPGWISVVVPVGKGELLALKPIS
jgi:predicted O-methyltransferase YrrM